jgi:hypothetical protein
MKTQIFIILFVFTAIGSCHNPDNKNLPVKRTVEINSQSQKSSFRLYCWCFLSDVPKKKKNDTLEVMTRLCNTTIAIAPADLIKKNIYW